MRSIAVCVVFVVVGLVGCASGLSPSDSDLDDAASVRERLERAPTRLLVAREASAGSLMAERRASGGWSGAVVDLAVTSGELIAEATAREVTLSAFSLALDDIAVPASVFGTAATLTDVRVTLAAPVTAPATWTGDDDVEVATSLALDLSWSISVDGGAIGLGAPHLPALPVELSLSGAGGSVHAELRALAPGAVWSWANLVRFTDLTLVVSSEAP